MCVCAVHSSVPFLQLLTVVFILFCSDELKKKISESYALLRSKAIEELRPKDAEWSELQKAYRLLFTYNFT